ncbi:universal stress protein [Pararhodobacter sp. SW119]|uniref:universal stress protein n=1 Tax=Pararhodobacter sp. SW119 TaxID=2780075 RepID=UPI001ADFA04F|nr:universal stress protein [Pararhodobacter sp. SW119]
MSWVDAVNGSAILAATDLTARSAYVAPRAALIARTLKKDIVLAHVGRPDRASAPADAPSARAEAAVAGDTGPDAGSDPGPLQALRQRLLGRRNSNDPGATELKLHRAAEGLSPTPTVRLLAGDPADELAGLAVEVNAVLMVLGLHRERRVLDLLRLTTMEQIVLAAPTPVLIAHRAAEGPYRRVLALTDFSPASAAALRFAAQIAPEAEFHAIHALQLPIGARFTAQDAASDDSLTQAEQMRAAFLSAPGLPELAESPEIVPGGVHEVLSFRQRELGADLVCVGTHSGRDPNQLGHYARDLMRAPPTDLLVAKPG